MRFKLVVIFIGCVIIFRHGSAGALTINFDDLEIAGSDDYLIHALDPNAYYSIGNFRVTSNVDLAVWTQASPNYNRSAALFYASDSSLTNPPNDGITTLSAVDGSLFDLASIDLNTLFNNDGPSPVTFSAYDDSDVLIGSETLTLNSNSWVTHTFSQLFTGVAYVQWTQVPDYHHFDNIVIDPVPEPATAFLLATGLAGLAGSRLRRKKE